MFAEKKYIKKEKKPVSLSIVSIVSIVSIASIVSTVSTTSVVSNVLFCVTVSVLR